MPRFSLIPCLHGPRYRRSDAARVELEVELSVDEVGLAVALADAASDPRVVLEPLPVELDLGLVALGGGRILPAELRVHLQALEIYQLAPGRSLYSGV